MKHHHKENTWPRHSEPDNHTKRKWIKALKAMVCNDEGVLHQLLGKWLVKNDRWDHRYHEGKIFIRKEGAWRQHMIESYHRRKCIIRKEYVMVDRCPADAAPVTDLKEFHSHMQCTPPITLIQKRRKTTEPKTFREYIQKLPWWERRLLKCVRETKVSFASLKIHLELQDKIWIVTDGRLDDGDGYFGW
eukprot:565797-Ditylum_brightwellii.AAC.1